MASTESHLERRQAHQPAAYILGLVQASSTSCHLTSLDAYIDLTGAGCQCCYEKTFKYERDMFRVQQVHSTHLNIASRFVLRSHGRVHRLCEILRVEGKDSEWVVLVDAVQQILLEVEHIWRSGCVPDEDVGGSTSTSSC